MLHAITALSLAAVAFVVMDLLFVTIFTSRHGLRLSLWRTPASWDRERKYLHLLAHSDDRTVARRARVLIKLDVAALLLMWPALILALISTVLR